MIWPIHNLITGKSDLYKILEKIQHPSFQLNHIFRGQSLADWQLKSSFHRFIQDNHVQLDTAINIEKESIDYFMFEVKRSEITYKKTLFEYPGTNWDWLAVMQHHGIPTRLLDWTRDPSVALYFAVQEKWGSDGAIWYFAQTFLNDISKTVGSNGRASFFPIEYPYPNDRIDAQQGLFTINENLTDSHDEVIDNLISGYGGSGFEPYHLYGKIIIPRDLKPQLLNDLVKSRSNGATLFPGLFGIGKSVLDQIKLNTMSLDGVPNDFITQKNNSK